MRNEIGNAKPDAAIIIGSNHFRGMYLDLIPAFTIGIGDCIGSGESGSPSGPQQVDRDLAIHLADSLIDQGFDPAFSARLQVDHGVTHAIQYLLEGLDIPIVPVVINVFAPPLPGLRRCYEFGLGLRTAIESFEPSRKIAVLASGGLSHRLPWPDWRTPKDADEHFLVEAWLNGRTQWKDYEQRRREIVLAASARPGVTAPINASFDREFLESIQARDLQSFLELSTRDLQELAGNGGQEIRAWIMAAAAMNDLEASTVCYEEMPEWLTGMGITRFTHHRT
jgi:2,3-dihydroxyphenylpropionate 1,2-dioxygenase